MPPVISTLFSVLAVKNARERPSGDQNGSLASSVPGSETAFKLSSDRTQRSGRLPKAAATNARDRPLGDSANWEVEKSPGGVNSVFSGGRIEKRVTWGTADGRRQSRARTAKRTAAANAATSQG